MPADEFRDDIPRGGLSRAVAALSVALGLLQTSGVDADPGLAIGSDPTRVATGSATTYRIDGVTYPLPATDNLWSLSGDPVPSSSWAKYALLVDATAAPSTISGVPNSVSASHAKIVQLGATAGRAVIGTVTVATDATATFMPGVDPLNKAGVTVTFAKGVDVSAMLPSTSAVAL